MRFIYFLILLVFIAAVAVFAYQNSEEVSLRYIDRTVTAPMSLLIVGVYLLGMVSGWTVIGFVKRSFERVTDRRRD